MTVLDPWARHRSSSAASTVRSPTDLPTTESEWRERFDWLQRCYVGDGYSAEAEAAWHLFQARDNDNKELARTRRLMRDFAFVTDSDAHALFGDTLVLQLPDELGKAEQQRRGKILDAGRGVWARSRMGEIAGNLAHILALNGRIGIEIRRDRSHAPFGSRLVLHEPHTFHARFDDSSGTELEEVTITYRYTDPADIDADGNVTENATIHVYQRRLTRTHIIVTLDGAEVAAESGEHNQGVVPFVLPLWQPVQGLAHGLNAAHGIESAIAEIDSIWTQISAIGKRVANPIPTVTGGTMASGTDAGQLGRWLYHGSKDARFGYMEPSMQGLAVLLDSINSLSDRVRATYPEFGLFGVGSGMSGEALKMLASRFESKIGSVRSRVLPAIARAVGIAVATEQDRAYDPEQDRFELAAGPILPPDTAAEIQSLALLTSARLIRRSDAIRTVQSLGYAPADIDPQKYVEQIDDESSDRAAAFFTSTSTSSKPATETE